MATNPRDELVLDLLGKIDQRGWAVVGVAGDDRSVPFTYTVGLTAHGHPELIVYGLPAHVAATILNDLGDRIAAGHPLKYGDRIDGLLRGGLHLAAIDAADTRHVSAVRAIYDSADHVLQIVWPDSADRLPWDSGYTISADAQPLVGPTPE